MQPTKSRGYSFCISVCASTIDYLVMCTDRLVRRFCTWQKEWSFLKPCWKTCQKCFLPPFVSVSAQEEVIYDKDLCRYWMSKARNGANPEETACVWADARPESCPQHVTCTNMRKITSVVSYVLWVIWPGSYSFLLVRGVMLAAHHHPVTRRLAKFLSVGSEANLFCPLRKAFNAVLSKSFNVKMPSGSDERAITAASTEPLYH